MSKWPLKVPPYILPLRSVKEAKAQTSGLSAPTLLFNTANADKMASLSRKKANISCQAYSGNLHHDQISMI